MKGRLQVFSVFLMIAIGAKSLPVSDTNYTICNWKGNAQAAVTYTFDDNLGNQYSIAIPMFNEFGFKATFYPVINWGPDWAKFKDAADQGHEIGCHTVSHPHLKDLSDSLQNAELQNARNEINTKVTGHNCQTIAYPYCEPSDDSITSKYFMAARHCQGYVEKATPDDFLQISSIVLGNQGINTTLGLVNNMKEAAENNGWAVYLLHALDNESGYSPLPSGVLRESLEYLDSKRDEYWVSNFIDAVRYIRERNCAIVYELEANADTIKVNVIDSLDNAIYNFPISILRPLPEGWSNAEAYQNGIKMDTKIHKTDTVDYVLFDAVPDVGEVIIVKTELPSFTTIIDRPYEVATWKGFTQAAITYTFDDASSDHYSKVIPMFNEFGFNATFYPVINWGPNWSAFSNAVSQGHEVGSHTVSHPDLASLSDSLQNVELKNSQNTINSNITDYNCLSVAYPYCSPSDDSITDKYYIAARNCQGNIEKTTPDDLYNISSITCGNVDSLIITAQDFNDSANAAAKINGWCVYLLHGIDSDGGYSPVSSTELRRSLEYLNLKPDTFWVSTFVNVVKYIRERNSVSVRLIDIYTDSIQVELTDTLDNDLYNYPVSIRRPMPYAWDYVIVKQNGIEVTSNLVVAGSKKYIEFEAVPDGGIVTLIKAEVPLNVRSIGTNIQVKVMPNPFNNELRIQADGQFNYYIHSLDGRLMEHGSGEMATNVGQALPKGLYLLNVQKDNDYFMTKIIKR